MTFSSSATTREGRENDPIFEQVELLRELRSTAKSAGDAISSAFAKGVVEGRRFDVVLRDIGRKFTAGLVKSALKPVELGIGELMNSGFRSLFGQLKPIETGQAAASSFGGLNVTAFADGGVISEPAFFGAGRNLGLMGERGAEAILPLARGPDGRLGVSAGGGGGAPSVTVNISTSDAASFRRSEGQISAAIARAVSRGARSL